MSIIAAITYHSKLLKWPGGLNVLQGSIEVLELQINLLLGSLGVLDGLNLESIDGLELAAHVVCGGLEVLEALLDLVNDGLVLEKAAVLGEVDGGGLLGQLLDLSADVLITCLEGLQGGNSLAAETERLGDLDPVELEGGAALEEGERN